MAFLDVIKYEGSNNVLVWKHPREDFNTNSQLIVHESQEAYAPIFLDLAEPFSSNNYLLFGSTSESLLTDNQGNVYVDDSVVYNKYGLYYVEEPGTMQFYLQGEYTKLTGTIYVPDSAKAITPDRIPFVQILRDDILLYEQMDLKGMDEPINFHVDITNVVFLTIKIFNTEGTSQGRIPLICLADLAVAK